jgi:hypothetical protein
VQLFAKDRYEVSHLINEREYTTAVEVGAGRGIYSEHLLYYSPLKKLHSIDIWDDDEEAEKECKERLLPFGKRSEIIKGWSKEVSESFDPVSIDFIFIDAGKDVRSITDDLIHWYDKVKPGGILAGKDYCLLPHEGCSIMAAVDKMCVLMDKELHITGSNSVDPIERHFIAHTNSPINQRHEIETPSWWVMV